MIEPLDLLIVEERMRERIAEGMQLPAGMDAQEAALWTLVAVELARRSPMATLWPHSGQDRPG